MKLAGVSYYTTWRGRQAAGRGHRHHQYTVRGAHGPALVAANAGKHVVVEKPLEITPDRCDRIINTCDKNKVKLCTIFRRGSPIRT